MIRSRSSAVRISRRPLIALAAVPLLALSGCTFGGHSASTSMYAGTSAGSVKKVKVNRAYTGSVTGLPGGTFTPSPDGNTVTVQDRPYSGDYAAALPKKVRVQKKPGSEKTFKLKALAGTYYASVDGTAHSSGTGQWTGLQLVRFTKRALGIACVQFTSTSTNNDRTENGTFALIGGTRASRRARFAGTFSQTAQESSTNTSPVSGVIAGKLKFNKKPRALNAECRALLPKLP